MSLVQQQDAVRALFRDAVTDQDALVRRLLEDKQVHAVAAESDAADTAASAPVLGPYDTGREIKKLSILPAGAVTANDTNYATITVEVNDGAGGAKTELVALTTEVANGNWVAGVPIVLTLTADDIPAGGVIWITVAKAAAGVQLPAFKLQVDSV
jgi:hypothetical protein